MARLTLLACLVALIACQGALGARTLLDDTKSLTATIDTDLVKGSVSVTQNGDGVAQWSITFSEISSTVCPGGLLNWHVHAKALETGSSASGVVADGSNPVCLTTSGHYDPTFKCNGASEYQKDASKCPAKITCDNTSTDSTIATCEIGNQGGKMGKIPAYPGTYTKSADGTPLNDKGVSIAEWKDMSIVFHCGSPRVICANF